MDNYFPEKFIETFELGVIFCLFGLIITMHLTFKENTYYQKQK